MPLPTTKTPPKASISNITVLMHGRPKIGKSTWCSQAEGAIFLATEPGLNHLEVFQTPILCWQDLLNAAAELAAGKHQFKTVIIDTIDNAYLMCSQHVCAKLKVEHPADLGFGKGFSAVNGEFHRVLTKLAMLPYGLFLVSHSKEKEIETRTGKLTKVVPTLPDKAREIVVGLVDVIAFADIEIEKDAQGETVYRRVLRTKPHVNYEAGDRSKKLPPVMDLDFGQFAAAWSRGVAPAAAPAPAQPAPASSPAAPVSPPAPQSAPAPAHRVVITDVPADAPVAA